MITALVTGLAPLARVAIEAGTFAMGSTRLIDSRPVTEVTVSAFKVSETKVTVGAYREYLEAIRGNCWTLAVRDDRTGDFAVAARGHLGEFQQVFSVGRISPGTPIIDMGAFVLFSATEPEIPRNHCESLDQPMSGLTWWEMLDFAAAHGGDLPTEAEYERIQRGRTGRDEYGTKTGKLKAKGGTKLAHFGGGPTAPVKTYPPNNWGVYDASGNVWSWTKDWYATSYRELSGTTDPRGPCRGTIRVLRGGSCYFDGEFLRAACRSASAPVVSSKDIGGVVVWRG